MSASNGRWCCTQRARVGTARLASAFLGTNQYVGKLNMIIGSIGSTPKSQQIVSENLDDQRFLGEKSEITFAPNRHAAAKGIEVWLEKRLFR